MTSDLLTVDPTLKPYKRVKENEKNAKSHMHTTREVEHPWWQEWLNVVDKQKCAKVTNTGGRMCIKVLPHVCSVVQPYYSAVC